MGSNMRASILLLTTSIAHILVHVLLHSHSLHVTLRRVAICHTAAVMVRVFIRIVHNSIRAGTSPSVTSSLTQAAISVIMRRRGIVVGPHFALAASFASVAVCAVGLKDLLHNRRAEAEVTGCRPLHETLHSHALSLRGVS